MKRFTLAAVAAVSLAVSVVAASPATASTAPEVPEVLVGDCAAYSLYFLRGSGEAQVEKSELSDGWEGEILARATEVIEEDEALVTRTKVTAMSPDLGYEAISPLEGVAGGYLDGMVKGGHVSRALWHIYDSGARGAAATARKLATDRGAEAQSGCASAEYGIFGFSQGAVASRIAYDLIPDFFGKVMVIGDLTQTQHDVVRGSGADHNGIFNYWAGMTSFTQDDRTLPTEAVYAEADTFAYCIDGDNFCAPGPAWLPGIAFNGGPHNSYFSDAETGREELAEWMATWEAPPRLTFGQKRDVPMTCGELTEGSYRGELANYLTEASSADPAIRGDNAENWVFSPESFFPEPYGSREWVSCVWTDAGGGSDTGHVFTNVASLSPDAVREAVAELDASGVPCVAQDDGVLCEKVDVYSGNGVDSFVDAEATVEFRTSVFFIDNLMVRNVSYAMDSDAYIADVLETVVGD
jgi:hypothetical protein